MKLEMQPLVYSLVVTAVVTAIAGCASQPDFDSVYTRVEASSLDAGSEIPAPQEEAVLTVSGKIGTTNDDSSIIMDVPTIEAVGMVEYTVQDPFEKEEKTFTGVLMRDLLELWRVPPDATVLNVTALNDYRIEVPIDLVRDYPVLFALKEDGTYMTPDYRGPAMLVFPVDDYKFELGTDSYWVWQIQSISVE